MTFNSKTKERIDWIDYAKALGVFLVIMGHTYKGYSFIGWIYSFHMPLFFFLSGITLKIEQISCKEFLKKRVKSLLIPYILYSIVYIMLEVIKSGLNGNMDETIKYFLRDAFWIRGQQATIGLWFLPLLFLVEVLLMVVYKGIRSKNLRAASVLFITAMGFLYADKIGKALPWGLDAALVVIFFLYAGYVFKQICLSSWMNGKQKDIFKYSIIGVGLLFANIIFNNYNMKLIGDNADMYSLRYGNEILYILSALAGIGFISIVLGYILKNVKSRFWRFMGRNTLHIYCLHGLALMFVRKVLNLYVIKEEDSLRVIGIDIVLSVCTFLLCFVVICVQKSHCCNKKNRSRSQIFTSNPFIYYHQ